MLAMERASSGSVFNVGDGDEVSINRVIELLEEESATRLTIDFGQLAKGDARRTSADTQLARAELGWEPIVPIAEGLRAQLDWVSGSPILGELVG